MLVSKKNRVAIYSEIFKEGVLVAPKDVTGVDHKDLGIFNVEVIQMMRSLVSRGYVKESFSWEWYYWQLTDEGVEYLRSYLHLPAEIIPATHVNKLAAQQEEIDEMIDHLWLLKG